MFTKCNSGMINQISMIASEISFNNDKFI